MEYANLCLIKRSSIKRKIKYAPIYVAYGLLSKKGILEIIKEANTKINVLLAFPVGIYLRKNGEENINYDLLYFNGNINVFWIFC